MHRTLFAQYFTFRMFNVKRSRCEYVSEQNCWEHFASLIVSISNIICLLLSHYESIQHSNGLLSQLQHSIYECLTIFDQEFCSQHCNPIGKRIRKHPGRSPCTWCCVVCFTFCFVFFSFLSIAFYYLLPFFHSCSVPIFFSPSSSSFALSCIFPCSCSVSSMIYCTSEQRENSFLINLKKICWCFCDFTERSCIHFMDFFRPHSVQWNGKKRKIK